MAVVLAAGRGEKRALGGRDPSRPARPLARARHPLTKAAEARAVLRVHTPARSEGDCCDLKPAVAQASRQAASHNDRNGAFTAHFLPEGPIRACSRVESRLLPFSS